MTVITNTNNNNTDTSTTIRRCYRCCCRNRKCISWLITILLGIVMVLYEYAVMYWLPSRPIPDQYYDINRGHTVTRRKPDLLYKLDENDTKLENTPFDAIMEGHLTLIDIQIPIEGVLPSETDPNIIYDNVKAKFCHISWDLQYEHPSHNPMFNDLQKSSFLCPGTIIEIDNLYEIARMAEQYDARNVTTFISTKPIKPQGAIIPTAVIFHESKCGSTVLSNAFAAFRPHHTRVYSEAQPPIAALQACEHHTKDHQTTPFICNEDSHIQLIRDVFYLMGRISRPVWPQYVFYKIQSIGTQSIQKFIQAFPTTPWIFVYRNSVEVLMSHFEHYQHGEHKTPKKFMPTCLRAYEHNKQFPGLLKVLERANRKFDNTLTAEEYCAAHIAALAEAAIEAHNIVGPNVTEVNVIKGLDHPTTPDLLLDGPDSHHINRHWFINYNKELPYIIWESILPALIPHGIKKDDIIRMHNAVKVYSQQQNIKLQGDNIKDEHFKEDSTLKQGRAPESIENAAKLFLYPTYEKLENVRKELEINNNY